MIEQIEQAIELLTKGNSMLEQIREGEAKIMATLKDLQNQIAALQSDVAAETSAEQSAITLLKGLSGQVATLEGELQTAIANSDPAGIQAVSDGLTSLKTTIEGNTGTLAAAVTANTPTPAGTGTSGGTGVGTTAGS